MILVHILGSVLALVGIALFIHDQIKGGEGESTMSAWKINLSGPPALILILMGTLVFIFPFTSFWQGEPGVTPGTTTTTQATQGTSGTTTTSVVVAAPPAPFDFDLYFHDECGGDVIEWFQEDIENVFGWWLSIEVYDPVTGSLANTLEFDTQTDSLFFGNRSALCYWDFIDPTIPGATYEIFIYSYNTSDFSAAPLFVSYTDNVVSG